MLNSDAVAAIFNALGVKPETGSENARLCVFHNSYNLAYVGWNEKLQRWENMREA